MFLTVWLNCKATKIQDGARAWSLNTTLVINMEMNQNFCMLMVMLNQLTWYQFVQCRCFFHGLNRLFPQWSHGWFCGKLNIRPYALPIDWNKNIF